MNDQFKVGMICIGQNHVVFKHRNDEECEIIGPLEDRPGTCDVTGKRVTGAVYTVRWSNGDVKGVPPYNLRRKPPKHKEWADEAIRKLKKQSSDHVAVQLADAIPEEA